MHESLKGIQCIRELMPKLVPGNFAEDLTTAGRPLNLLMVGTRLKVGSEVYLKITQIGKKHHSKCNIHKTVGDCIVPNEGIFADVLAGGSVSPSDSINTIND